MSSAARSGHPPGRPAHADGAPLPAAILLVEDLDDHAILHLDCEEAIESIAGEAPE